MELSLHADYALRVLIYLGTHPGRVVTTREMASAYGISKHHLVRVVQTLERRGYVKVTPGRAGGVTLAQRPGAIGLGDVVRDAEPALRLVECFDRESNTCPIAPVCRLKPALLEALDEFLRSLNRRTLEDILAAGASARLAQVFVQIGAVPG